MHNKISREREREREREGERERAERDWLMNRYMNKVSMIFCFSLSQKLVWEQLRRKMPC